MGRSHHIPHWDPEDLLAWEAGNKAIARRNLIWSIMTVHLRYSVWSLWSVMVLFMPQNVYGLSVGDKFLLATTATLVGACLRIPYSLATVTFGDRNWTVFSAFVLLIPRTGQTSFPTTSKRPNLASVSPSSSAASQSMHFTTSPTTAQGLLTIPS
jgi:MFS transporter, NNP family, nitrate/nitrite transporter